MKSDRGGRIITTVGSALIDLGAESAALDDVVVELTAAGWRTASAAPGWSIAHQIAHLAWTDDLASTAILNPQAFRLFAAGATAKSDTLADETASAAVEQKPAAQLLRDWRRGREKLAVALASAAPDARIPWFGPSMATLTMVTARIMETWAHGQDILDGLGLDQTPTARLRHIAHIGVKTRDFSYRTHGGTPPEHHFRVELIGPGGESWVWGPADAEQCVAGNALDFCLLVTQRRHRDDVNVVATGPDANNWLNIAQAFAGPPGAGRKPAKLR